MARYTATTAVMSSTITLTVVYFVTLEKVVEVTFLTVTHHAEDG